MISVDQPCAYLLRPCDLLCRQQVIVFFTEVRGDEDIIMKPNIAVCVW